MMQRSAVPSDWAVSAAEVLAAIEARSEALRGVETSSSRNWRSNGRLVARSDVDIGSFPVRTPADGQWTPVHGLPPLAADALQLSSMPGRPLRLRAYYPRIGLTAAVHEVSLRTASALTRGARVAARMQPPPGIVIPRQLEARRWLRRAWAIEELLAGTPITRREWPGLAPDVARGLGRLWLQANARAVSVRRAVSWLTARRLESLLYAVQPDHARASAVSRAVDRLLASELRVLVGTTHGDPSPNNVLRMPNDRLALIDWERAGRNLIGLDACRLLAALDDPAPALEVLDDAFHDLGAGSVHPVRHQAAIALVGLLPTWARQEPAWRAAGRTADYRARNTRRLQLLEALLGV